MSLPHEGCEHQPVVRTLFGNNLPVAHFITCGRCDLLLDFRSLESLRFNTDDWRAEEYGTQDSLHQ